MLFVFVIKLLNFLYFIDNIFVKDQIIITYKIVKRNIERISYFNSHFYRRLPPDAARMRNC